MPLDAPKGDGFQLRIRSATNKKVCALSVCFCIVDRQLSQAVPKQSTQATGSKFSASMSSVSKDMYQERPRLLKPLAGEQELGEEDAHDGEASMDSKNLSNTGIRLSGTLRPNSYKNSSAVASPVSSRAVSRTTSPPLRSTQNSFSTHNSFEKHVAFELQGDTGHVGQRGMTPVGHPGQRGVTPNGNLGAPTADLPGDLDMCISKCG
jgi:hypothetical protein